MVTTESWLLPERSFHRRNPCPLYFLTPARHRRAVFTKLIQLTGLCLVLCGCATGQRDTAPITPAPYMRVSESPAGIVKLEVAARRFAPRRGDGPALWLTGASHLGEPEYYRALQKHLDGCTRVLFEGVGGDEMARGPRAAAREQAARHSGDPAEGFSLQSGMARALGLAFQLEAIEYDRPNFKNSDLSVDELRDLMARPMTGENAGAGNAASWNFEQLMKLMEGKSVMGGLLQLGLGFLGGQQRLRAMTKFTMIQLLGQLEGDMESLGALPPAMRELMRVLVVERNQKVLADLEREMRGRGRRESISVFYGAGHMKDLEQRLRGDMGYVPKEEIWFTAMSIDTRAAGLSAAEVSMTREMVRKQLRMMQGGDRK